MEEEIRKQETTFLKGKPKQLSPPLLHKKKTKQMYLSYYNQIEVIRVQPNTG